MFRKIVLAVFASLLLAASAPVAVYAATCGNFFPHTETRTGKTVWCQTCCTLGGCLTTCH